jgi:hypothetical protein
MHQGWCRLGPRALPAVLACSSVRISSSSSFIGPCEGAQPPPWLPVRRAVGCSYPWGGAPACAGRRACGSGDSSRATGGSWAIVLGHWGEDAPMLALWLLVRLRWACMTHLVCSRGGSRMVLQPAPTMECVSDLTSSRGKDGGPCGPCCDGTEPGPPLLSRLMASDTSNRSASLSSIARAPPTPRQPAASQCQSAFDFCGRARSKEPLYAITCACRQGASQSRVSR